MAPQFEVPDVGFRRRSSAKDHAAASSGLLLDGRPVVREVSRFERYSLTYHYFDATELEAANLDDVVDLLRQSGVDVRTDRPEVTVHGSVRRDARGRPMWEVVIAVEPDW